MRYKSSTAGLLVGLLLAVVGVARVVLDSVQKPYAAEVARVFSHVMVFYVGLVVGAVVVVVLVGQAIAMILV